VSKFNKKSLALSTLLSATACAAPQGQGSTAFTGSPYDPRPVGHAPDNGTLLGGVAGRLTNACNEAVDANDPNCPEKVGAQAALIWGVLNARLP